MGDKKYVKYMSLILLIFILISVVILSYTQPMYPDDYNYAFVFGTVNRVDSFSEIFESLKIFYLNWGGRVIPMFLVHIFLWWGKGIFSICNTAVFFGLCYIIYKITLGINDEKIDYLKLLLVHILVLFGVPCVTETVLWEVGSLNYLWLMLFAVMYIYPYFRDFFEKDNIEDNWKSYIGISIVGFFAGMANENVVAFLIGANIIYIIYEKIVKKKIKIWSILGLFFTGIGSAVLLLAPGNAVRAGAETKAYNIPSDFMERFTNNFMPVFKDVIKNHYFNIEVLFIVVLISYLIIKGFKNKKCTIALLLVLSAILSNVIMAYPSTYSARASFGGGIFIIMAIGLLGSELFYLVEKIKIGIPSLIIVCTVILLMYLPSNIKMGIQFKKGYDEVVEYVYEEKEEGNLHIVIDPFHYEKGKFFQGCELNSDSGNVFNQFFCKYYGLASIKTNR